MDSHVDHVGGRSGGATYKGRVIAFIVGIVVVVGMFLAILFGALGGGDGTTRDVVEPQDTGAGSMPGSDQGAQPGGAQPGTGPGGGGGAGR
jgi:hypothetical protein